ncbi:MAG: lantibiotic dehydratase [Bacteroidota bacterium]
MSDKAVFPLMLIRVAGLPLAQLTLPYQAYANANQDYAATEQRLELALSALSLLDQERETDAQIPAQKAVMNLRRQYRDMLRTGAYKQMKWSDNLLHGRPDLIPILTNWNLALLDLNDAKTQLETEYEVFLQSYYTHLQQVAKDETLPAALLYASHDLLKTLPAFASKPPASWNKNDRQTALSLWQYLARAATKTTPLTRFSTVTLMRPEQADEPYFTEAKAAVTPNVGLLPLIYEVLLREPAFYRALSMRLNPCITKISSPLEWLYYDGTQESIQQTEPDAVLLFVLELMLEKGRTLAFPALLEALTEAVSAPTAALESFVLELIALGVLEWRLPEPGISASWCGGLYQFLGFLPAEPVIVETAHLLQWLRTAARTLPFQSIEGAMEAQQDAYQTVKQYLEAHGVAMPPISPARIFFEDVEQSVDCALPPTIMQDLVVAISKLWHQKSTHPLPRFKSQLSLFAQQTLHEHDTMDFMAFSRAFLAAKPQLDLLEIKPVHAPGYKGKIGALVQIFKEGDTYKAVLNALFPGGGKLFARWIHLFPAQAREQLEGWMTEQSPEVIPFPWHDWSNANFQPFQHTNGLAVPDGRLKAQQEFQLGDLQVVRTAEGPRLKRPDTEALVWLTDLGLEAPTQKMPVLQVLWQLGVPHVSVFSLHPEEQAWQPRGYACRYRARVETGMLVLLRASWVFEPAAFERFLTLSDALFFREIQDLFQSLDIPERFFVQYASEKPQYFDYCNPLSMKQLQLILRQNAKTLVITEMLPAPNQCVVEQNGLRAAEFVLEFDV